MESILSILRLFGKYTFHYEDGSIPVLLEVAYLQFLF